MILEKYQPKEVLKHFEAISQIPRGSGNEKAVSDYIYNFAEKLNLKAQQDKWNNIIVFKPSSPGYEEKPAVILQAHLDMVCEKNAGTVHDFTKDPLKLYVDGDTIRAEGTTLGGDNGIGVALCMAALESETSHPPLEIVLTTDEESGMTGALNLSASLLKATRMINLDSGDDSEFVMGCAAGTMAEFFLPVKWEASGGQAYKISVSGLKGGHSGLDITDDRGNALRILGYLLDELQNYDAGMKIASASGGMKVNAIPRESEAVITFAAKDAANRAENIINECSKIFVKQYRENDLQISMSPCLADKVMSADCGRKFVSSLLVLPLGTICMSREIENLPNASCNIGVLNTEADGIKISIMPRGAANFYNRQTESQIKAVADLAGARLTFSQRSPAWPYNPDSALLKTAMECYKPVFGRDAKITATHGGLECGILLDKIPGLDIVAFGPTQYNVHTPDEGLSIKSTEKSWEFLKNLLKAL